MNLNLKQFFFGQIIRKYGKYNIKKKKKTDKLNYECNEINVRMIVEQACY